MRILICGPRDSGCERLLRVLVHLFKLKNRPFFIVETSKLRTHDMADKHDIVCVSNSLSKAYPHITTFDRIFLCIRDCRYISEKALDMTMYSKEVHSWSIFANTTIPYEMYGPSQLMDIAHALELSIDSHDISIILNKVRIVADHRQRTSVDVDTRYVHFMTRWYLTQFGYVSDKVDHGLHHSASWT